MAKVTHKYEFATKNPVITFGAGWSLSNSTAKLMHFKTGVSLSEVVDALVESFSQKIYTDYMPSFSAEHELYEAQNTGTLTIEQLISSSVYPSEFFDVISDHRNRKITISGRDFVVAALDEQITKTDIVHEVQYVRLSKQDSCTVVFPTISQLPTGPTLRLSGTVSPDEQYLFTSSQPGVEIEGWEIRSKIEHSVVEHTTEVDPEFTTIYQYFLNGLHSVDYVRTPRPMFTVKSMVTDPEVLQFTNNSLYRPTQVLWNFGDGNSSDQYNPVHRFDDQSRIYNVTLSVTNAVGTVNLTRAVPAKMVF